MAQTDISSYCFEDTVNLKSVERSIGFLLLPKDTVHLREDDHCIDLVLSADRVKLFEKFLSGRYNLRREIGPVHGAEIPSCQIVLRTTVKQKSETDTFKVGEKNALSTSERTFDSTSSMELVLSQGVPGELEVWPLKLKVICRLVGAAKANLQFSFADKTKGAILTESTISRGEWLNIGSVVKDLNEKNKTLGIPQTEVTSANGKSETIYDLQLK